MKRIKNKITTNNPVAKFAGLFNKASVVESKKRYTRNTEALRSFIKLSLAMKLLKYTLNTNENAI